jgi:hypothetical protein
MHAVAAHQEEVAQRVCVFADDIEAVVAAKIGRVGLGHVNDVRVLDILGLEDADLGDFGDGKLGHLRVRELPQVVGFVAEVFESDPDFVRVADQPGAPVIEDLQAAYDHVRLLDVDPVVLEQGAVFLGDRESGCQQAYGDEVAVHESFADLGDRCRSRRPERANEVADRHG